MHTKWFVVKAVNVNMICIKLYYRLILQTFVIISFLDQQNWYCA